MRSAAAATVLGLALATGVPAAWALARPSAAAGVPVAQVLETSPASPSSPGTATPAVPVPPEATSPPAGLAIAALGIDAPIEPVGVAPDGQMAIPGDVARVGWYRFGPAPGGVGNAVLAGHVDDAEQGLGVLAPLREIAEGTEVVVTHAAGTATRWRVVSRELMDKQVLPLDAIFARAGTPRLVLITCGGPFLPELRSYRDNVVVVAEPLR